MLILRTKKSLTQAQLSDILGVKRPTIGGYEAGTSTPDVATLVKIAEYFDISIDRLLKGEIVEPIVKANVKANAKPLGKKAHEITVVAEEDVVKYEGKTRAIPILDARAAAGWPYTLDNSSFLFSQPTLSLPPPWFRSGEYVLIQIEGDSMHPTIYNGDWVFIRKLENVNEIKDSYVHVVLTHDGIVCKRLLNRVSKGHIALQSDNSAYPTYTVPVEEIISIWRVEMKMSAILRNENLDIVKRLSTLEADIAELKAKKKG